MEFDSLDVEKDFPGLYASEGADIKLKKNKEDSDYSEGEHDKVSKKDLLIGRRKDKKDKKDRGYAALGGESSPDEDIDAKSPSKSKKSLAFKFTSSKSKEKREKSRDKSEKEGEEKIKEKDKPDKEKDKKKDKDRKDKDKKDKSKDKEKDKSSKKSKQQTSITSDEVLELGDVQPVFGVSVTLAAERSRCHDGIDLPLVVRDCIDYLQEHALCNEQIYKIEPLKARLQHFKRLYNNREHQPEADEFDLATACGLLKLFLRELPEPILSSELIPKFEEVASYAPATKQLQEFKNLLEQLPKCNKTLLGWLLLHFDAVINHEETNKLNAQSLAVLLSPLLQMSHRLLVALLCHCSNLFAYIKLIKYVPPITASSPKLPETADEIQRELCKQESLLDQIHAEMNAGFVSKKREELLWEVQRIITQLKRKLRTLEKLQGKSIEDNSQIQEQPLQEQPQKQHEQSKDDVAAAAAIDVTDSLQKCTKLPAMLVKQRKLSASDEDDSQLVITESLKSMAIVGESAETSSEKLHEDEIYIDKQSGLLMLPKSHADYLTLLRLQLENQELITWKDQLQARITAERSEMLHLKQSLQQKESYLNRQSNINQNNEHTNNNNELKLLEEIDGSDYERIVEHYMRENTLLENKRNMLAKEIFQERRECIDLQIELAVRQFCSNGTK